MVKKRSKRNKQSIKKSNVEDRTEKNKNFMHLFLLPFSLSENMFNFCNNFFIIITFYLLFFLPIFYKYVKVDVLDYYDLDPEMKYVIRQKRKYKRNYNFYDIFIILIFFLFS